MYKIRYCQWALSVERLRSYEQYLEDFDLHDDEEITYRRLDVPIKYNALIEQNYCIDSIVLN